jgi:hypothetical protein
MRDFTRVFIRQFNVMQLTLDNMINITVLFLHRFATVTDNALLHYKIKVLVLTPPNIDPLIK